MAATEITTFFKKNDPKLAVYVEQLKLERLQANTELSLFFQICQTIIGQQLSNKAAAKIEDRFIQLFSTQPTPHLLLMKNPEELRGAGLSWAKVRAVNDLAKKIVEKQLILEELPSLHDDEVIKRLITVKGIGTWTAEMVLLFSLGREDIISAKDLGLKKGLQKVYNLKKTPSEQELLSESEKWKPYRSYGSLALWKALDSSNT